MTVLTKPRVEKIIYKLVDEEILPKDYNIENMSLILRSLGNKVYEDIIKEESDIFSEYDQDMVKKCVGKNTPQIVKEILKEQGRM